MRMRIAGWVAAGLALTMFGILATLLYWLSQGALTIVHIEVYALVASALTLFIATQITELQQRSERSARPTRPARSSEATRWRALRVELGMGFLSPFLYFLLLSGTFKRLGPLGRADEAYVLNALWPVLYVLFSSWLSTHKLLPSAK